MSVHLFFKCILSLLFLIVFLNAPFSSSGILERCVCPVTWGNKDMTYVSVLIYSSDVKKKSLQRKCLLLVQ